MGGFLWGLLTGIILGELSVVFWVALLTRNEDNLPERKCKNCKYNKICSLKDNSDYFGDVEKDKYATHCEYFTKDEN